MSLTIQKRKIYPTHFFSEILCNRGTNPQLSQKLRTVDLSTSKVQKMGQDQQYAFFYIVVRNSISFHDSGRILQLQLDYYSQECMIFILSCKYLRNRFFMPSMLVMYFGLRLFLFVYILYIYSLFCRFTGFFFVTTLQFQ